MSSKHVSKDQPSEFKFSNENQLKIQEILKITHQIKKKAQLCHYYI
jgi:hypothetical protein